MLYCVPGNSTGGDPSTSGRLCFLVVYQAIKAVESHGLTVGKPLEACICAS